ncbi:hypothetical protein [Streptomyces sp. B3I8]|uniref:hypothetical protein n=1 Tax=Streptomyces sp. B3I8 TaxID=3042303 RepID=UPI0027D7B2D2|nr:hypothetical protein [Streptomyces sp. B3I8]
MSRVITAMGSMSWVGNFAVNAALGAAFQLGTDLFAQALASWATGSEFHVDWTSVGINAGLGAATSVWMGPNWRGVKGVGAASTPRGLEAGRTTPPSVPRASVTPEAGTPVAGKATAFKGTPVPSPAGRVSTPEGVFFTGKTTGGTAPARIGSSSTGAPQGGTPHTASVTGGPARVVSQDTSPTPAGTTAGGVRPVPNAGGSDIPAPTHAGGGSSRSGPVPSPGRPGNPTHATASGGSSSARPTSHTAAPDNAVPSGPGSTRAGADAGVPITGRNTGTRPVTTVGGTDGGSPSPQGVSARHTDATDGSGVSAHAEGLSPEQRGGNFARFGRDRGMSEGEAAQWGGRLAEAHRSGDAGRVAAVNREFGERVDSLAVQRAVDRGGVDAGTGVSSTARDAANARELAVHRRLQGDQAARDLVSGVDRGLERLSPEQRGGNFARFGRDRGMSEGEAAQWGGRLAEAHRSGDAGRVAAVNREFGERVDSLAVQRAVDRGGVDAGTGVSSTARDAANARELAVHRRLQGDQAARDLVSGVDRGLERLSPEQRGGNFARFGRDRGMSEGEAAQWGGRLAEAHRSGDAGRVAAVNREFGERVAGIDGARLTENILNTPAKGTERTVSPTSHGESTSPSAGRSGSNDTTPPNSGDPHTGGSTSTQHQPSGSGNGRTMTVELDRPAPSQKSGSPRGGVSTSTTASSAKDTGRHGAPEPSRTKDNRPEDTTGGTYGTSDTDIPTAGFGQVGNLTPEQRGGNLARYGRDHGMSEAEANDWGARLAEAFHSGGGQRIASVNRGFADRIDSLSLQATLNRGSADPVTGVSGTARDAANAREARTGQALRQENAAGDTATDLSALTPEQRGGNLARYGRDHGMSEAEANDWGARLADAYRSGGGQRIASVNRGFADRLTEMRLTEAITPERSAGSEVHDATTQDSVGVRPIDEARVEEGATPAPLTTDQQNPPLTAALPPRNAEDHAEGAFAASQVSVSAQAAAVSLPVPNTPASSEPVPSISTQDTPVPDPVMSAHVPDASAPTPWAQTSATGGPGVGTVGGTPNPLPGPGTPDPDMATAGVGTGADSSRPDTGKARDLSTPVESPLDVPQPLEEADALEIYIQALHAYGRALENLAGAEETYAAGMSTSSSPDGEAVAAAWERVLVTDAGLARATELWQQATGRTSPPLVDDIADPQDERLVGGASEWLRRFGLAGHRHHEPEPGEILRVDPLPLSAPPVANYAVEPSSTNRGPATQMMIPGSRDIVIAHRLVADDAGAAAQAFRTHLAQLEGELRRQDAGSQYARILREQIEGAREDLVIFQRMRPRGVWQTLRPPQAAALVMAERRGHRTAAEERQRLIDRLRGEEWIWARNYPLDDAHINGLVDQVHEYLRTGMHLTVNVPLDKDLGDTGTLLDHLLSSGPAGPLLVNAWQVSPDNAVYLNRRGQAEEHMGYAGSVRRGDNAGGIYRNESARGHAFVPTHAGRADLPKYAGLTSPRRPLAAFNYGSAVLYLRREVRDRATFTPRDSFNAGEGGAQQITGPDQLWPLLARGWDEAVRLAFAEATDFAYDAQFRVYRDQDRVPPFRITHMEYFEAQIHGDVTWHDLDRVVLVHSARNLEQVREQQRKLQRFAAAHNLGFTVDLIPEYVSPATGSASALVPAPTSTNDEADHDLAAEFPHTVVEYPAEGWLRETAGDTAEDGPRATPLTHPGKGRKAASGTESATEHPAYPVEEPDESEAREAHTDALREYLHAREVLEATETAYAAGEGISDGSAIRNAHGHVLTTGVILAEAERRLARITGREARPAAATELVTHDGPVPASRPEPVSGRVLEVAALPLTSWYTSSLDGRVRPTMPEPGSRDHALAETLRSDDGHTGPAVARIEHDAADEAVRADADLLDVLTPLGEWAELSHDQTAAIVAAVRHARQTTGATGSALAGLLAGEPWGLTATDPITADTFEVLHEEVNDVLAYSQEMIPAGRDLQIAHHLLSDDPSRGEHDLQEELRQTEVALVNTDEAEAQYLVALWRHTRSVAEDLRILTALRDRSLAGLTAAQVAALVVIERRAVQVHEAERQKLIETLRGGTWAWARNYPLDDAHIDELLARVHAYLRDQTRVTVNVSLGLLSDRLLQEPVTLFRNVWEVAGRSRDYYDKRGETETRLGYEATLRRTTAGGGHHPAPAHRGDAGDVTFDPDPAGRAELPKYGALTSPLQPQGAYMWGDVAFHLRQEVRGRVSHTPGDSLQQPGLRGGRGVTGPDHLFPLLTHGHAPLVRFAFAEATGFAHDSDLLDFILAGTIDEEQAEEFFGEDSATHYFETQIHGAVTWSDVERIVLVRTEGDGARQEELRRRLEAFAVEHDLAFQVELYSPPETTLSADAARVLVERAEQVPGATYEETAPPAHTPQFTEDVAPAGRTGSGPEAEDHDDVWSAPATWATPTPLTSWYTSPLDGPVRSTALTPGDRDRFLAQVLRSARSARDVDGVLAELADERAAAERQEARGRTTGARTTTADIEADIDLLTVLPRLGAWHSLTPDQVAEAVAAVRHLRRMTGTTGTGLTDVLADEPWNLTSITPLNPIRFAWLRQVAYDAIVPSQEMVPGGRDLQIARELMVDGPRAGEGLRQEYLRARTGVMNAARYGTAAPYVQALQRHTRSVEEDLRIFSAMRDRRPAGLTPAQMASMVVIERRGQQVASLEMAELVRRLRGGAWAWARNYPLQDVHIGQLLGRVHGHLRNRMRITVNIDIEARDGQGVRVLDRLLENEVLFRNRWEMAPHLGVSYLQRRGETETHLGYAATLRRTEAGGGTHPAPPPMWSREPVHYAPTGEGRSELPRYGALTSPLRPQGADAYGDAVFYLRQDVRGRVTHTPEDSVDAFGLAGVRGVTGPDHLFPLLVHGRESLVRLAFAEATDFAYDRELRRIVIDGRVSDAAAEQFFGEPLEYFETQIHGAVRWSDVERVVLLDTPHTTGQNRRYQRILEDFAASRGLGLRVELYTAPTHQGTAAPAWVAPAVADGPAAGVPTVEETPAESSGSSVGVFAGLRVLAEAARVDTEWFDAARSGVRRDGRLAGSHAAIRFDVRRFQTAAGVWVADLTVRVRLVPVGGVADGDVREVADRVAGLFAREVNGAGYRLPGGDLLHVNVEFVGDGASAHHRVRVHAGGGATTTRDWFLSQGDGVPTSVFQLGHEVGHMVGLKDQYLDPAMALRHRPGLSAVREGGSVMAAHPRGGRFLSDEDLARIHTVITSGPVIRDLPHPLAPTTDTAGDSGGTLSITTTDAPLAEEAYATAIQWLLALDPVDTQALSDLLRHRASSHWVHTPSALRDAFTRVAGVPLAEAVDDAVAAGRLTGRPPRDMLHVMGLTSEPAHADAEPGQHASHIGDGRFSFAPGYRDALRPETEPAEENGSWTAPATWTASVYPMPLTSHHFSVGSGGLAPTAFRPGNRDLSLAQTLRSEDIEDAVDEAQTELAVEWEDQWRRADAEADSDLLDVLPRLGAWRELSHQQVSRVVAVARYVRRTTGLTGQHLTKLLAGAPWRITPREPIIPARLPELTDLVLETLVPSQHMVPGGRDLEVARALMSSDPQGRELRMRTEVATIQRTIERLPRTQTTVLYHQALSRHAQSIVEDLNILLAIRNRRLNRLTPAQVAALVVIERRTQQSAGTDRQALVHKLRSGTWHWARNYPLQDAHIGQLISRVHGYLRDRMRVTVNVRLSAIRAGRTVLAGMLASPQVALRSIWEIPPADFVLQYYAYLRQRGQVEERLGYAASLRRTTVDGGFHQPPLALWGRGPVYFAPEPAGQQDLPKYGALTSPLRPQGVEGYGEAVFYLRQDVRGRVTYTPYDSMDEAGLAGVRGVTGPDHLFPLLAHGHESLVRLAFAEATDFAYDPDLRRIVVNGAIDEERAQRLFGLKFKDAYFEAQIHGTVAWSDVERVVLMHGRFDQPVIQQYARTLREFFARYGHAVQVETRAKTLATGWDAAPTWTAAPVSEDSFGEVSAGEDESSGSSVGVFAGLRVLAEAARVDTEWFDAARSGVRRDGRLAGSHAAIRFDVRRFQTAAGVWVADLTVRVRLVPVGGVADGDVREVADRVAGLFAREVNGAGYRLPGGDLLHVNVEFVGDGASAHHRVRVHAGGGATTTRDWFLSQGDGVPTSVFQLGHEVGHMVGLKDQYLDPAMALRHRPGLSAVREGGSVMAAHPRGGRFLSDEDLARIHTVITSGPVIRDLPHPLAPTTDPAGDSHQGAPATSTMADAEPTVPGPAQAMVTVPANTWGGPAPTLRLLTGPDHASEPATPPAAATGSRAQLPQQGSARHSAVPAAFLDEPRGSVSGSVSQPAGSVPEVPEVPEAREVALAGFQRVWAKSPDSEVPQGPVHRAVIRAYDVTARFQPVEPGLFARLGEHAEDFAGLSGVDQDIVVLAHHLYRRPEAGSREAEDLARDLAGRTTPPRTTPPRTTRPGGALIRFNSAQRAAYHTITPRLAPHLTRVPRQGIQVDSPLRAYLFPRTTQGEVTSEAMDYLTEMIAHESEEDRRRVESAAGVSVADNLTDAALLSLLAPGIRADYPELESYLARPAGSGNADRNSAGDLLRLRQLTIGTTRVAVEYDPTEPQLLRDRRMQQLQRAVQFVLMAGFDVPDFRAYLPKYTRRIEVGPHGEIVTEDFLGGAIAQHESPNYLLLSPQLLSPGPRQRDDQGVFYGLAMRFDNYGMGVVVHELGHLLHHAQKPGLKADQMDTRLRTQSVPHATSLSAYAGAEPLEFVAEAFVARVLSMPLTDGQAALYAGLGGPLPVRASILSAPPRSEEDFQRLHDRVVPLLARRGDRRPVRLGDVARAYGRLPLDVQLSYLQLVAAAVADVIQTGRVGRMLGGAQPHPAVAVPAEPVAGTFAGRPGEVVTGDDTVLPAVAEASRPGAGSEGGGVADGLSSGAREVALAGFQRVWAKSPDSEVPQGPVHRAVIRAYDVTARFQPVEPGLFARLGEHAEDFAGLSGVDQDIVVLAHHLYRRPEAGSREAEDLARDLAGRTTPPRTTRPGGAPVRLNPAQLTAYHQLTRSLARYVERISREEVLSDSVARMLLFPRVPRSNAVSDQALDFYRTFLRGEGIEHLDNIASRGGVSVAHGMTDTALLSLLTPEVKNAYPELQSYLARVTRSDNTDRNTARDRMITRNVVVGATSIAVTLDPTEPSRLTDQRIGQLSGAVQAVVAAGFDVPDFQVHLPKYTRNIQVRADGRIVEEDLLGGAVGEFRHPNLLVLSPQLSGTHERARNSEGVFYALSLQVANPGQGLIIHELGHLLHEVQSASIKADLMDTRFLPGWEVKAASLSTYARGSAAEFVAEAFLARVMGKRLTEHQAALYSALGGPIPARPFLVSAPELSSQQLQLLLEAANGILARRGFLRVVNQREVARIHRGLPLDIRLSYLQLMAAAVADVIQTGRVGRMLGGAQADETHPAAATRGEIMASTSVAWLDQDAVRTDLAPPTAAGEAEAVGPSESGDASAIGALPPERGEEALAAFQRVWSKSPDSDRPQGRVHRAVIRAYDVTARFQQVEPGLFARLEEHAEDFTALDPVDQDIVVLARHLLRSPEIPMREAEEVARALAATDARLRTTRSGGAPVRLNKAKRAAYKRIDPALAPYVARVPRDEDNSDVGFLYLFPRLPDGTLSPAALMDNYQKEAEEALQYQEADDSRNGVYVAVGVPDNAIWSLRNTSQWREFPELAAYLERPAGSGNSDRNTPFRALVAEVRSVGTTVITYHFDATEPRWLTDQRIAQASRAVAWVQAAGFDVPALDVYLTKYNRRLQVQADLRIEEVDENDEDEYAAFVPPNRVFLSSELLKKGMKRAVTRDGVIVQADMRFEDQGTAVVVHELGHFLHYTHNSARFADLVDTQFHPSVLPHARAVSVYGEDPKEYPAEHFLGLVMGMEFTDEQRNIYHALGGPLPHRVANRVLPELTAEEFESLRRKVNRALAKRHDAHSAGTGDVVRAYRMLPQDLRLAWSGYKAEAIADILQTGRVGRRHGLPVVEWAAVPEQPVAGGSGSRRGNAESRPPMLTGPFLTSSGRQDAQGWQRSVSAAPAGPARPQPFPILRELRNAQGVLFGYASYHDAEWTHGAAVGADNSMRALLPQLQTMTQAVDGWFVTVGNGRTWHERDSFPLPWRAPGEPLPVFFAAHGSPTWIQVAMPNDLRMPLDQQRTAQFVSRVLPTLPAETPVVLWSCRTGAVPPGEDELQSPPLAQYVANLNRRLVWAPVTMTGATHSGRGALNQPVVALVRDEEGVPGRVLPFWPEPGEEELRSLTSAVLGNAEGEQSAYVLRLLRLLRVTVGRTFQNASRYLAQEANGGLLRDIRALRAIDTLRRQSPEFQGGPFTADVFRRLVTRIMILLPTQPLSHGHYRRVLDAVSSRIPLARNTALTDVWPELTRPSLLLHPLRDARRNLVGYASFGRTRWTSPAHPGSYASRHDLHQALAEISWASDGQFVGRQWRELTRYALPWRASGEPAPIFFAAPSNAVSGVELATTGGDPLQFDEREAATLLGNLLGRYSGGIPQAAETLPDNAPLVLLLDGAASAPDDWDERRPPIPQLVANGTGRLVWAVTTELDVVSGEWSSVGRAAMSVTREAQGNAGQLVPFWPDLPAAELADHALVVLPSSPLPPAMRSAYIQALVRVLRQTLGRTWQNASQYPGFEAGSSFRSAVQALVRVDHLRRQLPGYGGPLLTARMLRDLVSRALALPAAQPLTRDHYLRVLRTVQGAPQRGPGSTLAEMFPAGSFNGHLPPAYGGHIQSDVPMSGFPSGRPTPEGGPTARTPIVRHDIRDGLGQLIGYAFHTDADMTSDPHGGGQFSRESRFRRLGDTRWGMRLDRKGRMTEKFLLPWRRVTGAPSPYFIAAHGHPTSRGFMVPFDTGTTVELSAEQSTTLVAGLVRNLPDDAPLVLLICFAGFNPHGPEDLDETSLGQRVANATRRIVWATTAVTWIGPTPDTFEDSVSLQWHESGNELAMFAPEPTPERIAVLTNEMTGTVDEEAQSGVLRLVRLLRRVFGAGFEQHPDYPAYLAALHRTDRLRRTHRDFADGRINRLLLWDFVARAMAVAPDRVTADVVASALRKVSRALPDAAVGEIFPALAPAGRRATVLQPAQAGPEALSGGGPRNVLRGGYGHPSASADRGAHRLGHASTPGHIRYGHPQGLESPAAEADTGGRSGMSDGASGEGAPRERHTDDGRPEHPMVAMIRAEYEEARVALESARTNLRAAEAAAAAGESVGCEVSVARALADEAAQRWERARTSRSHLTDH